MEVERETELQEGVPEEPRPVPRGAGRPDGWSRGEGRLGEGGEPSPLRQTACEGRPSPDLRTEGGTQKGRAPWVAAALSTNTQRCPLGFGKRDAQRTPGPQTGDSQPQEPAHGPARDKTAAPGAAPRCSPVPGQVTQVNEGPLLLECLIILPSDPNRPAPWCLRL